MAAGAGSLPFVHTSQGAQTVPSGPAGSQNTNPLGTSVFSNLASTSPVVGTLPSLPTGLSSGGAVAPGGGYTGPGGNINAATQNAGDFTFLGDTQATLGRGTGTAVANLLGTLGTSTSQAEQLMMQPTMLAEQQGLASVNANLASAGYDPGSSASAILQGDVIGQTNAAIAAQMGGIGLSEENTQLNTMLQLGQAHGSDKSGWDTFGDVMGGIGNAALGLGEAYLTGGGSLLAGGGGLSSMLGGLFGGAGKKAGAANAASQAGIGATGMWGGA